MEIKNLTVGLIISGLVGLQEFVAILKFYDSQMVRPIRFLSLYMKFIVMMSISGIVLQ
jgi:hypothetical protein